MFYFKAASGLRCTKTRSVDQILDRSRSQRASLAPMAASADNLSPGPGPEARSASSGLQMSNVSSISTAPLPDISGQQINIFSYFLSVLGN